MVVLYDTVEKWYVSQLAYGKYYTAEFNIPELTEGVMDSGTVLVYLKGDLVNPPVPPPPPEPEDKIRKEHLATQRLKIYHDNEYSWDPLPLTIYSGSSGSTLYYNYKYQKGKAIIQVTTIFGDLPELYPQYKEYKVVLLLGK